MTALPKVDLTPRVDGLHLAETVADHLEKLLLDDATTSPDALLDELSKDISASAESELAAYASLAVLVDLHRIGWSLRVDRSSPGAPQIVGQRPANSSGRAARKKQLLAARDEALDQTNTRDFVRKMETEKRRGKLRTSIFSLVADGRELRERVERAGVAAIDAYVQLVEEDATCSHTGLLLSDVWRYFRLTWTNPPRSIPSRQMRLLVRDREAPGHAVIGIAELSGAAVKVAARDRFLGWDGDSLEEWWNTGQPTKVLSWAQSLVSTAIGEIYTADFERDGILGRGNLEDPDVETIRCLRDLVSFERTRHEYRATKGKSRTGEVSDLTEEEWRERSESPLFRSKRASRLSTLLEIRRSLATAVATGETQALKVLRDTGAAKKLLRLAKSRTQGTAIADLTVCGAIAPYNHLVAGKLVAALAAGPSAVAAYRNRYTGTPSVIASSMAGRPVVRKPTLVAISTTSLYGVRPCQYDRISVPVTGPTGSPATLAFSYLGGGGGKTKGWGTFHISARSARAIEAWLERRHERRRVTYTYGEGASPRLRLLREGIKELGWRPADVLIHGLTKSLYVCRLASNVRQYLIGMDEEPSYLFPLDVGTEESDAQISRWWMQRWVRGRVKKPKILERLSSETLAYPISHNARVRLPDPSRGEQISLFDSW